MAANQPSDENDDRSASSGPAAWWRGWTPFQRVSVVVAVLGVLGTIVFGSIAACRETNADPGATVSRGANQPPADDPPENIVEEVAARPFWLTPPTVYEFPEDSIEFVYDDDVEWASGDVTVVTPRELALEAVDYEGRSVILVGRVIEWVSLDSDFGLSGEIRLSAERGANAYLGTADVVGTWLDGAIVYALGRVVASGESRTLDGRTFRSAYFLNTDSYISRFHPSVGSAAIREAARRVSREPSNGS